MRQEDRVHGCSSDPVTCFPPELLWKMMWTQQIGWAKKFGRQCLYGEPDAVDRSGCGYNEVVLVGKHYKKMLPHVVEAFFYPSGDEFIHHAEGDAPRARRARDEFLRKYPSVDPEDVPILAYDLGASRDGRAPFRLAEDPPPPEHERCSCDDIADRVRRPLYPTCRFCPY